MRILVVDDDATLRECLGTVLETSGHVPLLAADLTDAMRMLRAGKIDALVADGLLPAREPDEAPMCSWGVLLVLFARAKGIPSFLLTGYDEIAEEARRVRLPVLRKPIRAEELLAAVEGVQP